MIGLRDNLTLSLTKLRVRRVRLVVTLVVSGIVFTVLVFSSLVGRGFTASLKSFSSEGLLNRYVTGVMSDPSASFDFQSNPDVLAKAAALDKVRLDAQVKEAKRLGLDFDPKTAPHGAQQSSPGSPTQQYLDLAVPTARQALVELTHKDTKKEVSEAAAPYYPRAIYESYSFNLGASAGKTFEMSPIIAGKELQQLSNTNYLTGDSLTNFQNELQAFSPELMQPFLLDGASLAAKPGEAIPVLAPIDAAEKLLGVTALPKKATPADKVARLADIRNKAKNLTFEVCYRNGTATRERDEAKQQAAEIAGQKGDKSYVPPELVFGPAGGPCLPPVVASDKRTPAEKALAAQQLQFDEEFGQAKPVTTRVPFRIVGIMPQLGTLATAHGLESAFTSLFTTTLGEGWFVPTDVAAQNPVLGPEVNDPVVLAVGVRQYYVDFADRVSQKRFIEEKGCTLSGFGPPNCSGGRLLINPFGNPLATLADAASGLRQGELMALSVIALLAAIVMMGTIGKIIADSRKETSVFRAVGAKRSDIAQIYLLYTVILATLAYVVAVVIGMACALWLESRYSADLSVQAVLAFNSHDLHKTFHIVGLHAGDMALIYLFVLSVALLASAIPLIRSNQRNPIKDMRED